MDILPLTKPSTSPSSGRLGADVAAICSSTLPLLPDHYTDLNRNTDDKRIEGVDRNLIRRPRTAPHQKHSSRHQKDLKGNYEQGPRIGSEIVSQFLELRFSSVQ